MSATESPVQSGASPIGGRFAGMQGWQKLGIASAGVIGAVALIVYPGLGGFGSGGRDAKPARHNESVDPKPFSASPLTTNASLGASPPAGGGQATSKPIRHRVPPIPIGLGGPASGVIAAPPPPQRIEPASQTGGGAPGDAGQERYGSDSLGQQISGATTLGTMHATVLRHPDFTITAGSHIPCLPVEAMNSAGGGAFISCRVPEWVRGTTMRRGLLPPGTLISGQIRNGMAQGQTRLGVLYTRIETAGDHFVVNFSAPGADAIGRGGVEGDLNTFFWDKVGEVALYALIDAAQNAISGGAQAAIAGALSRGNNGGSTSLTNLNFNGGGQSLAQTALAGRANRPPELERNQAAPIQISVGQDLDFYSACRQWMQVDPMACPAQ